VDEVHLTQYRDQLKFLLNTAMNLRVRRTMEPQGSLWPIDTVHNMLNHSYLPPRPNPPGSKTRSASRLPVPPLPRTHSVNHYTASYRLSLNLNLFLYYRASCPFYICLLSFPAYQMDSPSLILAACLPNLCLTNFTIL
jgi:hypothetical protein